jgi:hypothetical protein
MRTTEHAHTDKTHKPTVIDYPVLFIIIYIYYNCPRVADGEDSLQIWREAANILNKESRTADERWSSSSGFRLGTNNFSP